MFIPIIAASINNVPDPHRGSTKVLPGLHGVKYIIPAASVSLIGALFAFSLYPLLCSATPVVSIVRVTLSLCINTYIGYFSLSSFINPVSI